MRLLTGIIIAAVAFWAWERWGTERWGAVIYPNRDDTSKWVRIPEYDDLATCRSASLHYIRFNGWGNADYECGLNCRPYSDAATHDMHVCKETRK